LNLKSSHATISPMDKDNKLYEVAYLISPAYSEEEAQNFQQSLKSHVQSLGGVIDNDGEVIKRRLFYPIGKMTEAHLASFRFLLSPEKISELKMKLNAKEVLRFLFVLTKRQPARTYRQRIARPMDGQEKIAGLEKIAAPVERKIKQTETAAPRVEEKAAHIEEIDKKLEEILGK